MQVFELMKSLRVKLKYTLRKAVGLLGISHVHLLNIERNKIGYSVDLIEKMEQVYGYNPYVLAKITQIEDIQVYLENLRKLKK